MGNQYGPYAVYILSQLLEKRVKKEKENAEKNTEKNATKDRLDIFENEQIQAEWHRVEDIELLHIFCNDGYSMAKKYGHYIIGKGRGANYIGIPGRFLLNEQPAQGKSGFTLWQPLKGGSALYESLEEMDEETARSVYGYWIACLDEKTLKIYEV